MTVSSRHFDGSTDVWMRHYLTSLLNDPALRVPAGMLQVWLDQQVDPAAERLRDNLARVTVQHVVERWPQSVILGPAGSGKSVLIRQLVRQLAEEALANPHAPLPLYIPLTFFAGSIEGTLGAQARMRGPAVATLALQRPCILIVDALNDVAPTEQLEVLGMLRRAMHQLGPQGRWIINCRTEQWALFAPWLQASRSSVWRIRAWNDQTINSVLQRLEAPGLRRLAAYNGCIELARRARWLGSLLELTQQDTQLKPGQAAVVWVEHVFAEAAQAHCLSGETARVGLTLLAALAQAATRQPQQTLTRTAVIAVTNNVADSVNVSSDELLALLDAAGILDLLGDDEWSLRSSFLADLAVALELQHDRSSWAASVGQGMVLPLTYGLLDAPGLLVQTLIDVQAWDEAQRVLDANEDAAETLAVLEETHRVDIDSGAALGRVWARVGNPEVAVKLLRWAVRQGRDDPQLFGLLGDLYLRTESWPEARDVYTSALQRDPTNLHYQQSLARACHELGEDDVAATTLEQAMSTHHRQLADTAYHLGGVYEQRGRYHDAINQYMTAASLVPSDPRFGLAQARALRLLQRYDEARSLLRWLQTTALDPAPLAHEWAALMSVQGNDEQALVHLEHLVELGAATAEVQLQIGQIRRRHGEATQAHRAFSAAIDLDPRCTAAYEHLAKLASEHGDLQTAASAYRRLVELAPNDAAVFLQFGALLRQLNQYAEAVQALRESLRLAPTANAYLQLARVRWAQGEQADALRYYRSARELNPADGEIAAETGWALIESGDLVGALEPLNVAAVTQPNNSRVLYDLGRTYELQARRAEALEWYERAATVEPTKIEALRATGRVAYELGHISLARTYLAHALRCDRTDGDVLVEIGRLHLQARNGLRATRALRRALSYGCAYAEIRRDLAEALLLIGEPRDALRYLEQADEANADVQELRSKAYEQLGDPRMALAIARAAAAQRSRDHRLQRRLGMLALAAGHVSEALVALETAVTLGDTDAVTQLELSRALLASDKLEAALRPAELAVERAAHLARAHEQLGIVLLALGRIDDAGSAFEQAIALDAGRASAWGGLADVWRQWQGPSTALPYANHALELEAHDTHRLRVAQLLIDAGDYGRAQEVLETLDQPHLEAEQLLLRIAVATEQWALAVDAAERALEVVPHDLVLLATYGQALCAVGRAADAIVPLAQACTKPDAPATWWAWRGHAHTALEQWSAAADAFEHSLQRNQDQPELYAELAHVYMEQAQPITAVSALQTALERGGEREEWRAQLAEAYEALDWIPEALMEWQRTLALAPMSPVYRRHVGRLHLALGDTSSALVELEETTALDATDYRAWELYAQAALAAGESARAVHAAACALPLAPEAPEPRLLLGEALLRDGDPERALQCLTPLIEQGTPTLHTLLLLHEAAQAAGVPSMARRALEAAHRLAPHDAHVQLRLAAHFKTTDRERAIKLLRAFAQQPQDQPDVAASLAEQALELGELQLARTAAERAVELAPESQSHRRLLGHICFKLGDHTAARINLQAVLANRPHDATTALALGKVALERGEVSEALRLLQLAAQGAPDDAEVHGTLGLALRYSWQPVREDEPIEPQHDPALDQAIMHLEQAATSVPLWRAELGWTRLIVGDVQHAMHDLADAVRHLPAGSAERGLTLRRLALALMHAQHYDEATTVAGHAQTLAPNDPLTASIQGQLAEQRGEQHSAIQYYARAVALDPQAGLLHVRLGAVLLKAGELEVALDHLEQATELEPARAIAWTLLSSAFLRARQPDRALIAAQRGTQLAHDDGPAWRQLAIVAQALNQVDTALDAYEHATTLQPNAAWLADYAKLALSQKRDERAIRALRQALDLAPDNAEVAYQLAQLSQGQERAALLERAVQLAPGNTAWRAELAGWLATKGNHRSAIVHLAQAVDDEPHVVQHWIALSDAHAHAGDIHSAETALRRGLTFQPQSATLSLALAALLAQRQQWLEAYECFSSAAEYEASSAAYAGQGHCLLHLERLDQARAALDQAVNLDKHSAPAYADLARVYLLQRRFKEAIRDAREAVTIDASLVDAYRTAAEAALELKGDWIAEAHEALDHAQAIEPHAADLHALRGWAYYSEQMYDEAVEAARLAIQQAPDEASYYLLEAYALRRLRQFTEAIVSLRKAVKIKRNYREAIQELVTLTSELFVQGDRD